jgi:hypothetical protein
MTGPQLAQALGYLLHRFRDQLNRHDWDTLHEASRRLDQAEAADPLGIFRATADRSWRYAKTGLHRARTRPGDPDARQKTARPLRRAGRRLRFLQ